MKTLSLLCLILTTAGSATALTLSLTEIESRVRAHHPDLVAARLAIAEAQGRHLAAGRLANPTLDYDFQTQSNVSPQTSVFSISQAFPITRRLSLEKKLTSQRLAAAKLEVQEAERRLISEALQQTVRQLILLKQLALMRQQTELAKDFADFADQQSQTGEVSPLDAKQAQFDTQRLRVESRLLEAESLALLGRLKPMLGLNSEETLIVSGELPALSVPEKRSWLLRPDYQLSQNRIAAAQTDHALARAKNLPDITAGLLVSREMQDLQSSMRERTGFVGFRVSIPLPFWNRNQGEIAEKSAASERALLESQALAAQIDNEAATALAEMQSHASIVRDTRDTLLPLAVEQMDAMQKAYQAGQANLLSLLRARDQRLQLETSAWNAVRDFHLARIRYEAATASRSPDSTTP